MLSLDHLVVVLALGETRQPAWDTALYWAAVTKAQVHVLLPLSPDIPEAEGTRWLDSWLRLAPAGTSRSVVNSHNWCESVLHEARRQDAGLLIISAEAISERDMHALLKQLPCPLHLARRGQAPGRIGAAVSAVAEDDLHQLLNRVVLEHLRAFCGYWRAEPVLLSAFPNPADLVPLMGDTYAVGFAGVEVEQGYRDRLRQQAAAMHMPEVEISAQLGRPDLVIPQLCAEAGADLLLLGTVSRQALAAFWLGNTAEDLLLRIACDALVLRPQDYYDPD
jgi:nucleotide-binding universal stress UspA family protein